jgi:hypothetical protein
MKPKSSYQYGFSNPRLLIGLFFVLHHVVLRLEQYRGPGRLRMLVRHRAKP